MQKTTPVLLVVALMLVGLAALLGGPAPYPSAVNAPLTATVIPAPYPPGTPSTPTNPKAPYPSAPPGGETAPPPINLPFEVQQAIKNKQDVVEIAVTPEISKIFFIDYVGPVHGTPLGTDCGPNSSSFKQIRKGLKWGSFPVNYQVDLSGLTAVAPATSKAAVVSAFNSFDAEEHPAGAFFTEALPVKITVTSASIDGSGGTLAIASISFNSLTKLISSVTITYDSGDSWTVYAGLLCTSQGTAFDIEDIAAHEIGHAIGLDHVRKAADVAQTLYPFASAGETLKRTLGTGDKKGVDALY